MLNEVVVRPAIASEQKQLEALQWRALLNKPGDRDELLAHPDAIELPLEQIEDGGVFVAEVSGSVELGPPASVVASQRIWLSPTNVETSRNISRSCFGIN